VRSAGVAVGDKVDVQLERLSGRRADRLRQVRFTFVAEQPSGVRDGSRVAAE
jgi:hypothetical protein